SAPSLTAGGGAGASLEEKDIFETDFDLPALEDESASQAVALDEADTDLESSDFDLAVDESSPKLGGASGSTSGAMALDESASSGSMESVDEMLLEEEETQSKADYSDEEEEDEEVETIPAAEAEWGMAPVIVMACSIVVMFVAGLMSFELLHGMWGYH